MPQIACPIEGCPYKTGDVEGVVAAPLRSRHTPRLTRLTLLTVPQPGSRKSSAPRWSSAVQSKWGMGILYLQMTDYAEASHVTGNDKVMQLLQCCEEQLRKDLTRNTGGSELHRASSLWQRYPWARRPRHTTGHNGGPQSEHESRINIPACFHVNKQI